MEQKGKLKSRVPSGFDNGNLLVVKHGLLKFFRDPETAPQWTDAITKLAKATSILSYHVAILHHMHFLRMCEAKESLENWDQTTVDHAFFMVSGMFPGAEAKGLKAHGGLKPTEDSMKLLATYKDHFLPIFGYIDAGLKRAGALKLTCNSARVAYMTALKNNISTTFYSKHLKWIKMRLLKWRELKQYNGRLPKVAYIGIGKAAYHLAKWTMDPSVYLNDRITLMKEQEQILFEKMNIPTKLRAGFMVHIKDMLGTIVQYVPYQDKKIDDGLLQQDWSGYVQWFHKILIDFDDWLKYAEEKEKAKKWDQAEKNRASRKIRRFNLVPQHRVGIRHILIDIGTLRALGIQLKVWKKSLSIKTMRQDLPTYWNQVFKMDELLSHQVRKGKCTPNWSISTDGVACSTSFARPKLLVTNPPKKRNKEKIHFTESKVECKLKPQSSKRKLIADDEEDDIVIRRKVKRDSLPFREKKSSDSSETKEEKKNQIVVLNYDEEDRLPLVLPITIPLHSIIVGLDPGMRSLYSAYSPHISGEHKRSNTDGRENKEEKQAIQIKNTTIRQTGFRRPSQRICINQRIHDQSVNEKKKGKNGIHIDLSSAFFRRRTKQHRRKRRLEGKLDEWITEKQLNPKDVKNSIQSTKVWSLDALVNYWIERHELLASQWDFYSEEFHRKEKFDSYIRHQQSYTWACKRLLEPYLKTISQEHKKAGAKVVIAFGMARFKGSKGLPRPGIAKFYKCLSTQFRNHCIVVDTPEFYTSQKCPQCHGFVSPVQSNHSHESNGEMKIMRKKRWSSKKRVWMDRPPKDDEKKLKKEANHEKTEEKICNVCRSDQIYGLKACTTCKVVYDRDNMAAQGMWAALVGVQETGERPSYLWRSEGDAEAKIVAAKNIWQIQDRPKHVLERHL